MALHLTIAAVVLILGSAPAVFGEEWRQVGFFRAEDRNLSVGKGEVRVVSRPEVPPEAMQSDGTFDTTKVKRLYPGWDFKSDLVISYRLTPKGFQQQGYSYAFGLERKALPGDTIAPLFGGYDLKGDREVAIPKDLRRLIGSKGRIVAAASENWDNDSELEWVVVVAGPWDAKARGALMNISLIDRSKDGWKLESVFSLREPKRSGPVEIRDMTGDGVRDVIFRTFHQTVGHYWVEAHIYSQHADLPTVTTPPTLIP